MLRGGSGRLVFALLKENGKSGYKLENGAKINVSPINPCWIFSRVDVLKFHAEDGSDRDTFIIEGKNGIKFVALFTSSCISDNGKLEVEVEKSCFKSLDQSKTDTGDYELGSKTISYESFNDSASFIHAYPILYQNLTERFNGNAPAYKAYCQRSDNREATLELDQEYSDPLSAQKMLGFIHGEQF